MRRVINMRSLIYSSLFIAIAACGTTPVDGTDQLDAPVGKADAASKPSGAYSNPAPQAGEFATLVLNADHTFARTTLIECIAAPCDPITQTGKFLYTHSTTTPKTYLRFYDADGNALDRYVWTMSRGTLKLELDHGTDQFSMTQGTTCASAGGNCVPLVPDACEVGAIGDANEYSCGGGLGVECCLPPQADTGCTAASDCSGALPAFCNVCSDGTTACAHWSCVDNACQIASCAN